MLRTVGVLEVELRNSQLARGYAVLHLTQLCDVSHVTPSIVGVIGLIEILSSAPWGNVVDSLSSSF